MAMLKQTGNNIRGGQAVLSSLAMGSRLPDAYLQNEISITAPLKITTGYLYEFLCAILNFANPGKQIKTCK
jgi:hypothetical protein